MNHMALSGQPERSLRLAIYLIDCDAVMNCARRFQFLAARTNIQLREANLECANPAGANLTDANLHKADLRQGTLLISLGTGKVTPSEAQIVDVR